jgi:polyisoprenoid-binding protein YceI
MKAAALCILMLFVTGAAFAADAPVTYVIDPDHTHPTFDADHLDGLSRWRGLFKSTTGTITLDRKARTGSVDVVVDVASVDFGNDALNEVATRSSAPPIFETAKFPIAHYIGRLSEFRNGVPTRVTGQLTLHGVARPFALKIDSFKCMEHLQLKREVCGADAFGTFDRSDYGITVGRRYNFKMDVTLRIQVEAIKAGAVPPDVPRDRVRNR